MTLRGNFLTDKGNFKAKARETILATVAANPAILGTATQVSPRVYTIEVSDTEGNVAYLNLDLSVTTVHPADRKVPEKKPSTKAEPETFVILD